MEVFGREHESFLRNYLELPNGIPSHDTLQRVFAMVPSEFLESFQKQWNEMLNSSERKLSLNILKVIEVGSKALSMKKKRFAIGTKPEKHLEQIMNL